MGPTRAELIDLFGGYIDSLEEVLSQMWNAPATPADLVDAVLNGEVDFGDEPTAIEIARIAGTIDGIAFAHGLTARELLAALFRS